MILRSEPSSRAALMGEQPNPWDLLQPQDATSRHRTFAPHSCGSRLYLHPALERARGQRLIVTTDLSYDTVHYLTVPVWRKPISRYGVKLSLVAESTSHGVVLISFGTCPREMVGIHRYKLVLLLLSSSSTPQMLRCQTSPSLWTLGGDQPVIPGVAFIR